MQIQQSLNTEHLSLLCKEFIFFISDLLIKSLNRFMFSERGLKKLFIMTT